jgi:hypothetical protein
MCAGDVRIDLHVMSAWSRSIGWSRRCAYAYGTEAGSAEDKERLMRVGGSQVDEGQRGAKLTLNNNSTGANFGDWAQAQLGSLL